MSDDEISGHLTPDGHELRQRVYFEDTDFSGRVYHARYLHFMERGRSDYLRLLGIHHIELATKGLSFAVSRIEIDFLAAAHIDDVVTVRTTVQELKGARIVLAQKILLVARPLIKATVTVALVLGEKGRPVRLTENVREAFSSRVQTSDL
jgi:acyl-CoA thioester hydrolase